MPFPHIEGDRLQVRPALVVSQPVGPADQFIWTMMITSARRSEWPRDISLRKRHAECGLPQPCVIRVEKIAPLELARVQDVVGKLPDDIFALVRGHLKSILGFA